jgi:hypothetical protein
MPDGEAICDASSGRNDMVGFLPGARSLDISPTGTGALHRFRDKEDFSPWERDLARLHHTIKSASPCLGEPRLCQAPSWASLDPGEARAGSRSSAPREDLLPGETQQKPVALEARSV